METVKGFVPTRHHPEDLETFVAMRALSLNRHELKEQHPKIFNWTYNSWDDMKQRCKKEGLPVHPELEKFEGFLAEAGPRIRELYTLDRILPGECGGLYEPNNIRWLDYEGQANNRKKTRKLEYRGEVKPVSVWAREFRQKRNTILNRIDKLGWSVGEALQGKRGGDEARLWDYHEDASQREAAEGFYLRKRLTGETPLEFCTRYFRNGIAPWYGLLEKLGFYYDTDEDPTSGIAVHCLPELLTAKDMLGRFEPVKRWLEQIEIDLTRSGRPAYENPKAPGRSRRNRSYRYRDPETEYNDYCESYPELAYAEEDEL